MTRVLFAGGGSGGHVFPGLAVAEKLRLEGFEIAWAGSGRGPEGRLATARGIDFHALSSRPVLGQGLWGKARATAVILGAAWTARRLVRRLDARAVVGTGGYASAPAVLGARLAGRPVLLLEPNAAPGLANRVLARFAAEAVVAYEGTPLGCPTVVTGVPVREEFFSVEEPAEGPPWRLLVLGGSQGARQLNELLPVALRELQARGLAVEVVHQAGERHVAEARQAYAAAGLDEVEVTPFIDDVAAAMGRAHLLISRAGAITLAEICAAGRPSLLVPLTIAAAHQVDNARRLVDADAATLIEPDVLDAATLAETLASLLADAPRRHALGAAARGLARQDAADAIAARVVALTNSQGETS